MLPSLSRTPIPRKDLAPKPRREKRPDLGTEHPAPGPPPSLEKAPDQRDHVAHEGAVPIEVRHFLGVAGLQTVGPHLLSSNTAVTLIKGIGQFYMQRRPVVRRCDRAHQRHGRLVIELVKSYYKPRPTSGGLVAHGKTEVELDKIPLAQERHHTSRPTDVPGSMNSGRGPS